MLVIKIGGGRGNALEPLLDEVARTWNGQPWVLVHGASARVDELSSALGRPPRFVTSPSGYTSRRTDRRTALDFALACVGGVNQEIVEALQARGIDAVGLSGLDGGLLRARRKRALRVVENGRTRVLRDDYTGTVERVNGDLLRLLISAGHLPVVCPPALGDGGEMVNVDGDRAAAAIARALGARELVLLTGAPGLLRSPDDGASLVRELARERLAEAEERWARGRMRLKLRATGEALDGGVERVVIAASRAPRPLAGALAGEGTVVR